MPKCRTFKSSIENASRDGSTIVQEDRVPQHDHLHEVEILEQFPRKLIHTSWMLIPSHLAGCHEKARCEPHALFIGAEVKR